MVTCPSCGSIVFIDMDGMAHFGAEEALAHEPTQHSAVRTPELPATLAEPEPFEMDQSFFETSPEPEPQPEPAAASDFSFEPMAEAEPVHDLAPAHEPEPDPEPEPEPLTEGSELNMDAMLGYEQPGEVPAVEPDEMGQPGDPLGLNAYANSEISQAKDGLLSFQLLISGIDSKELRESLREALQDSRFGWTAATLMSKIRKGVLRIDNISSVKTSILVNRIKRLPIQIRWEQHAITQMEGIEDGDVPNLGTSEFSDSENESF